uniref:Uncharacterized protein n=1 Tax=Heterorhabditis bacteriophora TaxID=37862 RepID=A0A1I7XE13_HETBA
MWIVLALNNEYHNSHILKFVSANNKKVYEQTVATIYIKRRSVILSDQFLHKFYLIVKTVLNVHYKTAQTQDYKSICTGELHFHNLETLLFLFFLNEHFVIIGRSIMLFVRINSTQTNLKNKCVHVRVYFAIVQLLIHVVTLPQDTTKVTTTSTKTTTTV